MSSTPKTSNTSLFDLNDDDDADLTLTHYGQSLSGMDELPDVRLDDDDDDDNPRGTLSKLARWWATMRTFLLFLYGPQCTHLCLHV